MLRTGHSFRTAFGKISDVISRVKDIGWFEAPLTDRGNTFAFNRWTKACKAANLRPVYGVELAVTSSLERKPTVDYWKFLAINELRPLHDLIYRATLNRKDPMLLYQEAMEAKGVVKIAGERVLLDRVEPAKDLFISLDPSTPRGLYAEARRRNHQFIAGQSNYYPREEDKETYRVAIGWRSSTHTYPCHILSDDEWRRAMMGWVNIQDIKMAHANRVGILSKCRAEMKKATILVPDKPKSLRQMCEEGAAKRGIDLADPVYSERLDRELKMIEAKSFEDYFYLVAEIIQYAKTKMLVGPGRGSSGGSLICFLLEITDIDPVPWELVFERFIDVTRSDYPDIDSDFSMDLRHLVFEYAEEKYGRNRVARLGSVSMFQSRSALNVLGAALKIPQWMVSKVSASVIIRSKGDSRADLKVTDTLKETDAGKELLQAFPEARIAGFLEDHPTNAGQHAAGLVMTNDDILNYVAVDARNNSAMCDKEDAKDLNLLKVDVLGLTQLSIFERTLELIGKPRSLMQEIPLDDQKAFEVLNSRKFSGVFQMGPTQQNIVIEVPVSEIEDVVAMTALCRPGPIGSGATRSWIERKNNRQPVIVDHPLLEPYMRKTFGVPVYQEQTLRIGREVGDLSWESLSKLRLAMSKSLGKEYFDKFGNPWKDGAIKRGMPQAIAEAVWEKLCSYGTYNFNRSHAVAYAIITYWTCWLKAHYPLEFAAATLDAEHDPMDQVRILRELKGEGIDYVPVDPDVSTDKWVPLHQGNAGHLVGPLTQIKGIGPAALREILDSRTTGAAIKPGIRKKLETAKTEIDSLYPVGDAIRRLHPDLRSINITSRPIPINDVQPGKVDPKQEFLILCQLVKLHPLDENEPGRVAKRGYKVEGPTKAVNFFVRDDTGEIFCKLSRFHYQQLYPVLMNNTRQGKSLFAIKGNCPRDFRMCWVSRIKYLGEPDQESRLEAAE